MVSVPQKKSKPNETDGRPTNTRFNSNYGASNSQASAEAAAKLYGDRNAGNYKMSSGPISQRASLGFKNIGDSARVEPQFPVREKKSHRIDKATIDGGMNHSNYSNKPGISDI